MNLKQRMSSKYRHIPLSKFHNIDYTYPSISSCESKASSRNHGELREYVGELWSRILVTTGYESMGL